MNLSDKQYLSELQIDCDTLAFNLLLLQKLIRIQSRCEFNLFWIYEDYKFTLHNESIDFLDDHINLFKRKITLKEFLNYDSVIYWLKPGSFDEFKEMIKGNDFQNTLETSIKLLKVKRQLLEFKK